MAAKAKLSVLFLLAALAIAVAFPAVAMAVTVDPSGTTSTSLPTIQSDKEDYAPGELVTLTGSNWQPAESVNIVVNDSVGNTWSRDVTVTADASGNITDQFNLPNSFIAEYSVKATGASGAAATASFTDGQLTSATITTHNATGTPPSVPCATPLTTQRTSFGSGDTVCAHVNATLNTGGVKTDWQFKVFAPGVNINSGTPAKEFSYSDDPNSTSSTHEDTFVPATLVGTPSAAAGTWTLVACKTGNTGSCSTGNTAGTKTFTVTAAAPVANNDSYSVNEDNTLSVSAPGVLGNDTGSNLTVKDSNSSATGVQPVSGTSSGALNLNANGSFTYAPNGNFNGSDSFTYRATNANGDSNVATVNITVSADNDQPVANGDTKTMNEDGGPLSIDFGALVSDAETSDANLTYNVDAPSPSGTLSGTGSTRNFIPAPDFNGTVTINYTVTDRGDPDGCGAVASGCTAAKTSAQKTVTVNVAPVNDAPSFTKGANQTVAEDSGAQTVADWATNISAGPNETAQNVSFDVTNDDNSLFTAQPQVSSNGTLTYTPAADAHGTATVTVKVKDDGGTASDPSDDATSAAQTFTITVNPVNDAPTISNITDQTVLEDGNTGDLAFTVSDVDNAVGGLTSSGSSSDTTLVPNANVTFGGSNGGRTLKVTPAANRFGGPATITVTISDGDKSATDTFNLNVTPVNDAPSFTKGADQTVAEDSGPHSVTGWATGISAGPFETQAVTFSATNDNNALFSAQPQIASDGTLTYTPAADASGSATVTVRAQDDGGTANGGQNESATQTFKITVNAVNDAPSFAKGADQTPLEDSGLHTVSNWASGISAGPAEEAGQQLDFIVSNTNDSLFTTAGQPQVAADGTLSYTLAADANGTATVSVKLHDNGGALNGGVDTSAEQTFKIGVTPVNDKPSFASKGDEQVAEDSGPRTVTGWVTSFNPGPANESGQSVADYIVTGANGSPVNSNLFTNTGQPDVSNDGTLTYTPAADASGSIALKVKVKDDGGTANGGVDTSDAQDLTITINAVNDAPSFQLQANPDQTPLEDSGLHNVAGFVASSSAGPNEPGQTVDFLVSDDNNSLFASGGRPSIDASGKLTYALAADANGTATVTVRAHDNGGIANGGVDTSAPQTFKITVSAVNDAPSFDAPANAPAINEDSGAQSVGGFATSIKAGPADESGQQLNFAVTNNTNASLFSAQPQISTNGTLTYTPAADAYGTAQVTVALKDDGGTLNGGADTSATKTFTITVNAVNDAPVPDNDTKSTFEDEPLTFAATQLVGNDVPGPANEGNQTLTVTDVGQAVNGNVSLQSGNITFTPAQDFNGQASFKYTVCDNGTPQECSVMTAIVNVLVSPVNDAPSFTKGADQTALEDAETKTVANWATGVSAGPNESDQTVDFLVTNDNNSLFSTQPQLSASGTLTYTPAPDANGTATVTVRLHDDGGTLNGGVDTGAPQTFKITVSAVNDAPSFDAPANAPAVDEDAGAQSVGGFATSIKAGPADESGQSVSFPNVTTNNNSLFAAGGQPSISSNGTLTYTPAANAHGTATVSVQAKDSGGTLNGGVDTSATKTFTITVNAVNDDPVAAADVKTTAEDTTLNVATPGVLQNDSDVDGDTLSAALNTGPTHGTATVNADGSFNYNPASNYNGSDSFTYTVSDGDGGTAQGTVSITVTPVNDNPEITGVSNNGPVAEGSPATVTVTATDVDNASGDLRYSLDCDNNGTFETGPQPANNATCTFNDNGTPKINVKVTDGAGGSATRSTNVTVTNVAPKITSFAGTPYFYGPLSFLGNSPNASKSSGAWTDPGTADTWTALLTYPAGETPPTDTLSGLTTNSFSNVGHTFASAGCKSTSLKVTDDDLGSDTATTTTQVGTGAFMAPMTNQPVTDKLKNGQVLPVKVKFTDCSGAPITNLTPAIRLVQGDATPQSDDTTATITPSSVSAADTLGVMRSNGDGSYIYNMSVNITLNKDYTVVVYPYGTDDPRRMGHVIQATK